MAGQYGNVKRTVQTLKVVRVDVERGLLLSRVRFQAPTAAHRGQPSVKTR